jgi:drug/metabolite transporter (DMT)-like permease
MLDVPRKFHHLIVIRSICGFLGFIGNVTSVKYMPISTASCIFYTCPIWTALLAFVYLKEKINKYDIL